MNRKLVALFLAAVMMIGLTVAAAEGNAIAVTDMKGRDIALDAPATRVVALTAADCEILCALGAENTLVGRGTYCDYPESILNVPVVDSGAETNIEEIIALQPQVVLMGTMNQTVEQVEALAAAGIQVVVSDAQDIEGVYTAITLIGDITGKQAEAAELTARMRATFDDVAGRAENTGKTVYFEVSPLQWGLWTAGKGTFMDELATLCGLTNAFADVEGWAQISEEQVLERNPDFIVTTTMYYGEGPLPVEEIMSRAGWESLNAIRDGRVMNADSNEITRPGPRLMNAAETLYEFVTRDATEAPAA